MFGWFKKQPTNPDTKQKENFQRHALQAEGSPFVRSMIAEVMCSIEEESVTKERKFSCHPDWRRLRLSSSEATVFRPVPGQGALSVVEGLRVWAFRMF